MSTDLTTTHAHTPPARAGAFDSLDAFANAQRMAGLLASSTMVPKEYQGNLSNCVIALEIASRLDTSPFMVMQHLNVIHGRPAWSAAFVIASVEASGKFGPLRYEWRGEDACRCVARDLRSGEDLAGTWITREMVTREGWASKTGSKWASMPEQMFRYRAASFWARAYAPGILMGMGTADEVREEPRDEVPVRSESVAAPAIEAKAARGLRAALPMPAPAPVVEAIVEPEPEPAPAPRQRRSQPTPAAAELQDDAARARDILARAGVPGRHIDASARKAEQMVSDGRAPSFLDAVEMIASEYAPAEDMP